jgi:hypothetical protein
LGGLQLERIGCGTIFWELGKLIDYLTAFWAR